MTPTKEKLLSLQEPAIELANAAGERIMEIYATPFEVVKKEDKSPLTEADMAAHETINSGLSALTPEFPILSEEASNISFAERSQWETYWLIDPLDGTREFVKRNGEFTVNIALISEHKPVLGVVYAPAIKALYYASTGNGAYKQQETSTAESIRVRKPYGQPVTVAGSRSHANEELTRYLDRLGEHNLISMGSALKACLVAEGKADIYPRFGPTSEWDTAAAQCIVEEAGGLLTTTDIEPMRYNTKESLLNPHFYVFGDIEGNWSQYADN